MRHVPALLARELAPSSGPMAYIVLMAFQVIALLNFWELVDALSQPQREFSSIRDPMTTYVSASPLFWFSILVAVPLLTMRLIAEERADRHHRDAAHLACFRDRDCVLEMACRADHVPGSADPFALYLPFLSLPGEISTSTWDRCLSLGIGLTTMGMMFVAIGLLFSALTRNQIVAAVWTFVVLFLMVVLTLLLYFYGARQQAEWAEAIRFLAVYVQVRAFGQGQLDLRTIALHLSVCVFALYVTVKILEAGRRR